MWACLRVGPAPSFGSAEPVEPAAATGATGVAGVTGVHVAGDVIAMVAGGLPGCVGSAGPVPVPPGPVPGPSPSPSADWSQTRAWRVPKREEEEEEEEGCS